jgi:hypothetical protein
VYPQGVCWEKYGQLSARKKEDANGNGQITFNGQIKTFAKGNPTRMLFV